MTYIRSECPSMVSVCAIDELYKLFDRLNLDALEYRNLLRCVGYNETDISELYPEQHPEFPSGSFLKKMSKSQLEILSYAARNLTNAQIAAKLNIAKTTIDQQFHRIYQKLNLQNLNRIQKRKYVTALYIQELKGIKNEKNDKKN